MTDSTEAKDEGMMGSVYHDSTYWNAYTNNLSNISTGQTSMPMTSSPFTGNIGGMTTQQATTGYTIQPQTNWIPGPADDQHARLDAIEAKMDAMMALLQDLRDGLELATAALNFP